MNRYAIVLGQPIGGRPNRVTITDGPAACNRALASLSEDGHWLRALARGLKCQFDELLAKPGVRRRWLRIERDRRRTKMELESLSDTELKDIGIDRADIPRIAHMLCVHGIDPRAVSL